MSRAGRDQARRFRAHEYCSEEISRMHTTIYVVLYMYSLLLRTVVGEVRSLLAVARGQGQEAVHRLDQHALVTESKLFCRGLGTGGGRADRQGGPAQNLDGGHFERIIGIRITY